MEVNRTRPKRKRYFGMTGKQAGILAGMGVLVIAIFGIGLALILSNSNQSLPAAPLTIEQLQQATVSSSVAATLAARPVETIRPFPTVLSATPTESVRPTPTTRPSTIDKDLIISSWKCTQQTYSDSVLFEGIVKNVSTRAYSFVEIRVATLDGAGKIRNTNTSYIESDVIYPNSTSSFKAYIDNNGGTKCAVVIESGYLK